MIYFSVTFQTQGHILNETYTQVGRADLVLEIFRIIK